MQALVPYPDSAAIGIATLTYETEVAFYRSLAVTVEISPPHCYHAAVEPGTATVVLVLEDLAPAQLGDQIAGCNFEQAAWAIDQAARLHGPRWGDPALGKMGWLEPSTSSAVSEMLPALWPGFVDRHGDRLRPVTLDEGPRLIASLAAMQRRQPPARTAVHNDYRLDDMLFGDDYCRSSYASLVMALFPSMFVRGTDRGDEMCIAMANRSAQMAAALDAASLLTGGSPRERHRATPRRPRHRRRPRCRRHRRPPHRAQRQRAGPAPLCVTRFRRGA